MTAEDKLQEICITMFRAKYPEMAKILLAVPNGGSRNVIEAVKLKRMGVTPGVADLILLTPRHGYGSLCLELKVKKGDIYNIGKKNIVVARNGNQSDKQHEWELEAMSNGNKYVICWDVKEFLNEIEMYLN